MGVRTNLGMEERTQPGQGVPEHSGGAPTLAGVRSPTERRFAHGDRIGRYLVTGRLGAGGMGEVYAAHDPELDRPVAIKVLVERDEQATSALVREARAVASLSHDNVVPVYDVGRHGGRVFLAMELVDGEDLGRWLRRGGHSSAVKLRVLVQAGRGLQAAHDAGLVHGDFKPANVLVGRDGRARVIDFGLARETDGDAVRTSVPSRGSVPPSSDDSLRGTPGYLAPEQYARAATDPRSDQFSFCIATWEVMFGVQPFTGESAVELGVRVVEGRIDPPPKRSGVAVRIESALRRGLSVDPQRRWPSMDALLHELEIRTTHGRATIAALTLALVCGWAAWPRPARDRCDVHDTPIHAVWSAETRALAREALRPATAVVVLGTIDDYVERWATAYVAVCATRAEDDESIVPLRSCLERRRRELQAVVAVLSTSESEHRIDAGPVLDGLGAIEQCTDPTVLAREPTVGAEQQERIAELFHEIAECNALRAVGRTAEATTRADALAPRIAAVDWSPLTLAYDLLLSRSPPVDETVDEAIVRVEAAFARALAAHDDANAAELALDLAWQFGARKVQTDRAEHWLSVARSLLDDSSDDGILRMSADNVEGVIRVKANDFDRATAAFERALTASEARGVGPAGLLGLVHNLVRIDLTVGRNDRALERLVDARRLVSQTDGEADGQRLDLATLTGHAHRRRGDLRSAMREYDRTLAPMQAARGARDPAVRELQHGRALIEYLLGDPEASLAILDELVTDAEQSGESIMTASLQLFAARVLLSTQRSDRLDAADRLAARAMASASTASIEISAYAIHARVALSRGDLDRAREYALRASRLVGTTGVTVENRLDAALVSLEIAAARSDQQGLRSAIDEAELATSRVLERGMVPEALLELAHARWRFDVDRQRARELAALAELELVEHEGNPALLAEVRAWRAEVG